MTTLLPILGLFGTTPAAKQILQGNFNIPHHLDKYTKKLLTELAIPSHMISKPKISLKFQTQDYINGWSKMNEKTTSGISQVHFGHHLACSKNFSNASFETLMCELPYRTGYSPNRYQSSINAMLLKKIRQNRCCIPQNNCSPRTGLQLYEQEARERCYAPRRTS